MFVKLDDVTILDMSTGTCYTHVVAGESSEYNQVVITFNGAQADKYCNSKNSDGLWRWLNIAAMKFDDVQMALDKALAQ